MLDFDRKPSQKSADEIEFDSLCDVYKEQFGKPYVFAVGLNENTMQETLADIRRRIADNDPQPEPVYKKGAIY